ncbi:sensor histidine kinase [Amycolatopsis anabasis]|uniref:sensor histidine kinase n=1 Tax=Amycolatopsis anabasis TaxID=1840409 RepID=UPI0031B60AC4
MNTFLAEPDRRAAVAAWLRRFVVAPWSGWLWAELLWVVLGLPLTLILLVLTLLGLAAGVVLSPLFVGLLVIAGTLLAARSLGGPHRRLARRLLGMRIGAPPPHPLEPGLWSWVKGRVGDPVGWRAVAFLLLRLPLSALHVAITSTVLVYGIGAMVYPFVWDSLAGKPMPVFDIHADQWLQTIPLALFGLALLITLPWLVHGLLGVDRLLVRGLLGPTTLSERVRDLERSRATAVEDATVKLRRIERDLHDGAQAQLVALAMKLGAAKDELASGDFDVDQVRELVAAAHTGAKEALTELRDLARGIHPPALDAGLDVALSTLVARSAADVRLRVELPGRPPAALETIVYFSAAELLANATKHGGAEVSILVTGDRDGLRLEVTDSGPGGARLVPGGGLAGLVDRMRTVDGGLEIHSPAGGPTVITAEIPLPG